MYRIAPSSDSKLRVRGLAMSFTVATMTLLMTGSAAFSQEPEKIRLEGTVWDFKAGHPDFGVAPVGGNGHFAGNIAYQLNAFDRPVFTGLGAKVVTQWRDAAAHPIAPHLFNNGAQMKTVNAPVIPAGAIVDSWNSSAGAYGGGNVGPAPTMVYPAAMPVLSPPTTLPEAYGGNPIFSGAVTFNSSFRCESFNTDPGAVITIDGDIVIRCSNDFFLAAGASIALQPNAQLTLWVGGDLDIGLSAHINFNTLQPSRCVIYKSGPDTILYHQGAKVCAQVIAPAALMHMQQNDEFFGTYMGADLVLDQTSKFHWDGIPTVVCAANLSDTQGTFGSASTAAISSASSFEQWYSDVLGVNMSCNYAIELVKNGSGVYEYFNDNFYPVDNILFGNQGQAHNYFFTYSIRTTFEHNACDGWFFEFQGVDDAWLFINGELVMDLGGVIPNVTQHVQLDRLGLSDGEHCTFEFFFAQRQTALSIFRMRTNVPLDSVTSYATVSASVD